MPSTQTATEPPELPAREESERTNIAWQDSEAAMPSEMPSPAAEEEEAQGFPTFPEAEQPTLPDETWTPFDEPSDIPSPQAAASGEGNMEDMTEQLEEMNKTLHQIAGRLKRGEDDDTGGAIEEAEGIADKFMQLMEQFGSGKGSNTDKYMDSSGLGKSIMSALEIIAAFA
jgi:hypothetical protein